MENNQSKIEEKKNNEVSKKNWQSWLTIKTAIPICALVLILGGVYYFKGVLVAASVNGSPISRLSIIKDLEKQGGKQALDSLITKKLIETETKKNNIIVSQSDIDKEIKTIEQQVATQGGTLDMALQQQGITRPQLEEQLSVQIKLEKLLADQITITDQEVDTYIKDNKITLREGENIEGLKVQLKDQLQQEKFSTVAQKWIEDLKAKAKIKYYVNY